MSSSPSPFGQNEWLVEEMYRKFRDDPSSVDPSWHEFLVDYSPEPAGNGQPGPALTAETTREKPAETRPAPSGDSAGKTVEKIPEKPPAKTTAIATQPDDQLQVLRGAAAAVVKNMSASLEVPTATSVRAVPA
ncbi:MAG: multifunctional oxoglutarate decarboxylase/oxoglutarate dehydrogenase thiamine pyrophosphate-binding subunit/dihydrolipoyllysine-residue succinyltransferase subunit, partial [Mycolicibacterium sp.]|nr:multifunctional oxoglutarate decarboxylase/oxoglutarate dehydrogenase thiamine pyrophosphate-binding subunit/dihydrolipoyllysine-residue succinyltransferase subunit [Mycolicibacterium sp.]